MPGKRILVAEDDKPMARALQLKFTHEGFMIDVAANGEEALELIKKNHYDIILLDLVMPKVDGFGVLTELKEKHNTTPVYVLSNLGQAEDEAKVKELGAKGFHVKSDTPIATIIELVKTELS